MYSFVFRYLFTLLIFTYSIQLFADELIIEPDMGRKPILSAINQTTHQLNLVMYGLTDEALLSSIVSQKSKNRTVKVILERKPYKAEEQNEKALTVLKKNQIDWRGSVQNFKLIHQKTLILDNSKAIIMTFNFTKSTFKNQRNFALIIDDSKEVREISNVFSADFNDVSIIPHEEHLIWSPDNSRQRILRLVNSARQQLRIYAQSVNDYEFIGSLARTAKRGVQVRVLLSKLPREKQLDYLARNGVNVELSKKLYIHAKVIIIDQSTAMLGSINFTKASLNNNRELSVITNDSKVVKQLSSVFEEDWQNNTDNKLIFKHPEFKNFIPSSKTIRYILKQFDHYLKTH